MVPTLRARLRSSSHWGPHVTMHVRLERQTGELVRVHVATEDARRIGSTVGLRFARDRVHLFERATGCRLV